MRLFLFSGEIHLRHNKIRVIPNMVFHPLPELRELHLQNNSINQIEEVIRENPI